MSKAVIFIPDISGYTSFVHKTEVNHQSHILEELMDLLIDTNDLGLELAEIEGDALFYYQESEIPELADVVSLAEKMYVRFHSHLKYYETRRLCHCGACQNATGLSLKFVVHYGDISFLRIKDRKPKPHGKDIIVAHRLLKNDIPSNEYILVTNNEENSFEYTLPWVSSTIDFGRDDVGQVDYIYKDINDLKNKVVIPEKVPMGYQSETPITTKIHINKEPLDIFDFVLSHEHRALWSPHILDIKVDGNAINQVGQVHSCIIQDQVNQVSTIDSDFGKDVWVLGEKSVLSPFGEFFSYIIIKSIGVNNSEITFEVHVKSYSFWSKLIFIFFRRKIKKIQKESSVALKLYAEAKKSGVPI